MSKLSNSSFQALWNSILRFMFPCWNLTTHLPFQEESMIPLHLLKLMVNVRNMKCRTFWIHGFLIFNSSILFIGMGMMLASALRNQSRTYQMPWRRCMNFINDIQTSPSPLLMKFIVKKRGDVIDANAIEFIDLNDHPWLVINLYLTFSSISICS